MQPGNDFIFGPFHVDLANECLWRDGQAVSLTTKGFSVLLYLLRHAGRLVTKEELLGAVWPQTVVGDAVLKVYVGELRKVIGDNPKVPQFIETVHRRGYRFMRTVVSAQSSVVSPPPMPVASSQLSVASEKQGRRSDSQLATGNWQLTTSLVGRAAELQHLSLWLERALQGERQIVFVAGEAGIGKTTVVEAFLAHAIATAEFSLARGQCVEHYGIGEAYRPVFEAVRQLCREPGQEHRVKVLEQYAPTWLTQIPSLLGTVERERLQREVLGATQERMLREIAEVIEVLSEEKSIVLVLEDLQWSDYATLDLVATLARRREPARLLLIGTYRPVDVIMSSHPLKAVKQELSLHGDCQEISLELLPEAAVVEYLTRRFVGGEPEMLRALAHVIHRRTDGNPLFMVNVVNDVVKQGLVVERAGHWELTAGVEEIGGAVPENIRQMIERQVDRLGRDEQRVLEAASVAGMEFTTAVVAAALEEDLAKVEEWCEGLVRRSQLLRPAGLSEWPNGTVTGRYHFTHALYQEALYRQVSVGRRVQLHRRIGECEEAAYGDQSADIAAQLAEHFEQGRDYRRAVQYLQHAAVNDTRRYANREAIDSLTRALKLVERLTEAERPRLHIAILQQRGLVRRSMGDMIGAAKDFAALVRVAREQGREEDEMKALLYSAMALSWIDHEQCLATAEQAVALSPYLTDKGLQVHARAYYGYWHSLLHGWREEDAQTCATAVELARRTEDHALLSLHIGRHLYFQCLRSTYREVCQTAEDDLQAGLAAGDMYRYMTCQFFRAWALLHLGQWDEMLKVVGDGEQMADKNQHLVWGTAFRLERAWVYAQAGDFVRARELSGLGLTQALETGHRYGQLLGLTLLGWAHLGLEEAEQAFHCFSEITRRPEPILIDWIARMPLHYGLSTYWLAQGEFEQARQQAKRLCELAAQPGERTYWALGRRMLAEIALAERNWQRAETEIEQALTVVEGGEVPLAEWRVFATAGQVYERLHQRGKAALSWARSADILTHLAESLVEVPELRQSFLSLPAVQAVFSRTPANG